MSQEGTLIAFSWVYQEQEKMNINVFLCKITRNLYLCKKKKQKMKTWILFNEKDELLLAKDGDGYRLPTDTDWSRRNSEEKEERERRSLLFPGRDGGRTEFSRRNSEEKEERERRSLSFPDRKEERMNLGRNGSEGHHVDADDWVLRIDDNDAPTEMARFTLRQSWGVLSREEYRRAGKAWEILYWGEESLFCSRCGNPLRWNTDISRICDHCQREIWPQLNIAIIVLVHKGSEALLVKARTFRRIFFGLVAGFVETGESLEECVAREVREETTLEINNIRYFASQPWPYPLGLMVGFHADYAGGNVSFADGELTDGAFFRADSLPEIPEGLSMARMLIDDWMAKEKEASSRLLRE